MLLKRRLKLLKVEMKGSLSKAAHQYVEEEHQLAAWNFLESHLTEEVLDEFFARYCSKKGCLFLDPTWGPSEFTL
jgi:hypothetical protein